MARHGGRLVVAVILALVAVSAREAGAQMMSGASRGLGPRSMAGAPASPPVSTPAGTPGLYANPYSNPYANPFLNPYMAQYPMTSNNAAFFFIASQQANGGIGSGQLSGVRPARTATGPVPSSTTVDNRMRPTEGASRYFNRTTQAGPGLDNYYNRQGSYFRKNVH